MRERLSPGTIITLHCDGAPRQFQIDAVIGDGASCIAYDAHRTDGNGASLRYRLKECYPFHAQIERKGTQLLWASDSEKQAAIQRLERSHRLIVKLCNDKSVGNNITRAELCEGNGTLYAVMDVNHAKTYAFDDDQNLHSILDTMRVLTEVVGNLHAQGYLHLDIKPDNFLVSHRPSTNVWLFDVDSLASMDDLKSGAVQSISYSQQWAAPEQLLGQTGKLCEATDLFSIGAVLFEKVMGRQVQNADMGLFADWDFDGAMFDHVNPKVKRYLREIFRRTLVASVKRRYQSAGELLENLEKACDITIEGKPFLKSDCPVLTTQFVGRQRELLEIRDAFRSGKHAVFLHGIGGIGKSTLALAYGNQFQKEYDAVIFCRYRDSLEELFDDIDIQNFDGSEREHRKHLRRLFDEHALLIIDNFDVEIDANDFLDELMRLKCSILFTSRTDFSSAYTGDVKQIEVNALPYEKLEELFTSICGLKLETEEEQQSFHKLLKMVDGHTYFVELAAKQIVASGCSLDALYTALRNGISGLDGKEKVRTQKDGHILKRTIPEVLRVLFRVADLNRGQQQVLRNLYALRFIHVDKKIYRHFVCASISKKNRHENVWSWISFEDQTRDDFDILNDLVELGWVQKNGSHFSLHPLIEELIRSEQSPALKTALHCISTLRKSLKSGAQILI